MANLLNSTSSNRFNPKLHNELDIESLISAPLVATSKANVVMVTGQTNFLLTYCFTKIGKDKYEPVMIQMSMTRAADNENADEHSEPGSGKAELIFSVPLLCLVPINSLVVEKVTVDFDMEITSVMAKRSEEGIVDDKVQLNARISNDRNSSDPTKSQMKSKLSVNIDVGPLPLPVGVLTILDLYSKSILPQPVKK